MWRHIGEVRALPEAERRYWLFGVARHALIDDYRRRAGREPAGADPNELLDAQPDPQTVDGRDRQETALDMQAAVARLPEEQRTVLVMSAVGGMNSSEIGQALGCPAATVRYRLARARNELAKMLHLQADGEKNER